MKSPIKHHFPSFASSSAILRRPGKMGPLGHWKTLTWSGCDLKYSTPFSHMDPNELLSMVNALMTTIVNSWTHRLQVTVAAKKMRKIKYWHHFSSLMPNALRLMTACTLKAFYFWNRVRSSLVKSELSSHGIKLHAVICKSVSWE